MTSRLTESYTKLKKYASLLEEFFREAHLQGYGYDPGVLFRSKYGSLDLPEWFLESLYKLLTERTKMTMSQSPSRMYAALRCIEKELLRPKPSIRKIRSIMAEVRREHKSVEVAAPCGICSRDNEPVYFCEHIK